MHKRYQQKLSSSGVKTKYILNSFLTKNLFYISSLFVLFVLFFTSFFCCLSSCTRHVVVVVSACALLSPCVRRIGEYISLDLFYFAFFGTLDVSVEGCGMRGSA